MLTELQIENYAIIRSVKFSLDAGFNVITGETGAGKSILLGALSLILGQRADTNVLFDDTKKCIVEGTFQLKHLQLEPFFRENDLDYAEITTLRREINQMGKSRAFVNDTPVTLSVLKSIASHLIDIHSQQSHLLFQRKGFKTGLLDQFAQHTEVIQQYQQRLSHYLQIEKKLKVKQEALATLQKEQDYINFQINELAEASLEVGIQEELENKLKLYANAEAIATNIQQASYWIEEGEPSLLGMMKSLKQNCVQLASYDTVAEEWANRVEAIIVELKDLSFEIANRDSVGEVNEEEAQLSQNKLDNIYRLQQKYQLQTVEQLMEKAASFSSQIEHINLIEEEIVSLTKEYYSHYEVIRTLSEEITERRSAVIPHLESEVMKKMAQLGMEDGLFKVALSKSDIFKEDGSDEITFLFSANKGQTAQPLETVASGGEQSRMMLAMKTIISTTTLLPTVVFDEIDTGISGEIAGKAALMMADMANKHQLIVITHLPQVAAKGENHFFVYKDVVDDKTYTNVKVLTHEERVNEVAKMMSGHKVGDAAINAARELF